MPTDLVGAAFRKFPTAQSIDRSPGPYNDLPSLSNSSRKKGRTGGLLCLRQTVLSIKLEWAAAVILEARWRLQASGQNQRPIANVRPKHHCRSLLSTGLTELSTGLHGFSSPALAWISMAARRVCSTSALRLSNDAAVASTSSVTAPSNHSRDRTSTRQAANCFLITLSLRNASDLLPPTRNDRLRSKSNTSATARYGKVNAETRVGHRSFRS